MKMFYRDYNLLLWQRLLESNALDVDDDDVGLWLYKNWIKHEVTLTYSMLIHF